MQKLTYILIILVFLSCLTTLGVGYNTNNFEDDLIFNFEKPNIEDYDKDYAQICLNGVDNYLMVPGCPLLPRLVKAVELPFGCKNIKIEVIPNNVYELEIEKEIVPAPVPIPLSMASSVIYSEKDKIVYGSGDLYPKEWYSYNVGCGLNARGEHVTHVPIHLYPVRYSPASGKLLVAKGMDAKIMYDKPDHVFKLVQDEYDLVIITPWKFSFIAKRLTDFKNSVGVRTMLKTTNSIYHEYSGVDKPEQIKYFIKDAIEKYNIKYVLLFGGLKNSWYVKDRENANTGTNWWYVPVRYSNLYDPEPNHFDPGYLCDLYYADIYKEGGFFDDWDSNNDGIFAAWGRPNTPIDTLDLYPDVAVGRLPCRTMWEAKSVVEKIITYESTTHDPSWFDKITVIAGDNSQDQETLITMWDVNAVPDGEYTIFAQSKNLDGEYGPIGSLDIIIDRSIPSEITYSEDDEIGGYPLPPIAEILVPSQGNILGNTDVSYNEDYYYINGVLYIHLKSYDPKPYGVQTDVYIWIKNSLGEIIFDNWINGVEMYFEGEWETGEQLLQGRGGSMAYLPGFKQNIIWMSNGKFYSQDDVIEALSEGSGFIHFTGFGTPMSWSSFKPGIPGGYNNALVKGLATIDYFDGPPFLPMGRIKNKGKPFVLVVGGSYNSRFNITFFMKRSLNSSERFWYPSPYCWSWWLTMLKNRGAIATIGSTAICYDYSGAFCLSGLGGWIRPEFFKKIGQENHQVLGDAFEQTIMSYINNFGKDDILGVKTVQEWVLLGDPSLRMSNEYP